MAVAVGELGMVLAVGSWKTFIVSNGVENGKTT